MKHNGQIVNEYVRSLLYDIKVQEEMPEEFLEIEGMKEIDGTLRKLRSSISAIGIGDLSEKIQGNGYVFGIIKNLQSALRNLTWQTKAISSGDFSQRVDFLGEFSDSFNDMVVKLETAIIEVEEARDLFQMFFETRPDATMIISVKDCKILDCNRASEVMTGCSKNKLKGQCIKEIGLFRDAEQENMFCEAVRKKNQGSNLTVELKGQDDSFVYGLFSWDTILIEKEKNILCVIKDITERKIMEEKIRKLSETDALTQINNRGKLDSVLAIEIERLSRSDSVCSLIILDIDHFKKVNDTYGHLIGDEVLKEIANIIKNGVRKIDTVGRWGGEEFMIIMPFTDVAKGKILAEKLRKKISEHPFTGAKNLTASFGIAESHGDVNAVELVAKADTAMYQAKEAGRNQVCEA